MTRPSKPCQFLIILISLTTCACGDSNTGGDAPAQVWDVDHGASRYEFDVHHGGANGGIITLSVETGGSSSAMPGQIRYKIDYDSDALEGVTASGVGYLITIDVDESGAETRNEVRPGWDIQVTDGILTTSRRQSNSGGQGGGDGEDGDDDDDDEGINGGGNGPE